MKNRNFYKITLMIFFFTILNSIPSLFIGINSINNPPQTSEGIYGVDFNGIYPFDNYALGSDPWLGTAYGSASIVHSSYSHAYVYEIINGGRYLTVSNDMSSNWKIESYICCSALTPTGSGCLLIILHAINGNFVYYGYDKVRQGWVKRFTPGDGIIIQATENWTSNTWMYWRIEFTASSNTWRFYINNTLLDTSIYSGFDTLKDITFDCGSWGSAGAMRIDSLSYSWAPSYYEGMIFDVVSEDTDEDGMPDYWETENSLDPEDDTDALIDSDTDGLLNLYEYGNSTDPKDADSDNDLLNDGPEVKTYLTDPNDADSDNDGLNDGAEINTHGTDPNDADSDNDALPDGAEINTYSTDPNDADSDNDLLNDYAEALTYSTDPNDPDSDDDGFNDKAEIDFGTNPNDVLSYPGYIDPQRFTVFLILLIVAGFIGICGVFIGKKQHKRRYIS